MLHQSQFIEETKKWNTRTTIGRLVENDIARAGKSYTPDSVIKYIDISSVDNSTNTITGTTEYILKEAPSRAQQCIETGDILVSTVRPNLKNIAVNYLTDSNLVASSGFCVLRPKEGYTGLLLAYILSDEFTERMSLVAKGTNYPAVHDSDILDYEVTIPQGEEIGEIDALYKQADKSKFDGFKSQFIGILNSAENNVGIGDVLSTATKGKTPQYVEHSKVRVMNQACVHWDGMHWENVKYQDPEKLSNKEALKSSDILLNSTGTGTLGRCNIFFKPDDEYTYIPDGHLTVLSTKQEVMRPWILVYFIKLDDIQREIYDNCVTGSTNQVDLVRKNFLKIRIPLPDMASQILFDKIVAQADKSKYLN